MAVASSSLLVVSLWLAVVLGPQMRVWSWGPALLALAGALGCAAVVHARSRRPLLDPASLVLGVLTTVWFAWRAWLSPVAELAHADLLLLAGAVGGFLVARAIAGDRRAEAVFLWGCGILLLGNVAMVAAQVLDPEVSQFHTRPGRWPSGFYGHYNEGANFLIGASFLMFGAALFGKHKGWMGALWLLAALAGLAAVYFTRSRGAILGVAVGFAALAAMVLLVGAKTKARWFAPAIIIFPLLAVTAGVFLFMGWEKTQEYRTEGAQGVSEMMDNPTRLRNYSLAIDAIMLHPVAGGGSRSYSWESIMLWDSKEHGLGSALPEQVHNEILQAATDYGLLGLGLLMALLSWLALRGIWWCHFDEQPPPAAGGGPQDTGTPAVSADALRVGAAAAVAGMLVQSSFSFVFHLFPGALLLGVALGRLATPPPTAATSPRTTTTAVLAGLAAVAGVALVWPGIKGTRVVAAMLPVHFRVAQQPDDEEQLDRLTRAIAIWPQAGLHHARAIIHHDRAIAGGHIHDAEALRLAHSDYQAAAEFNPKFPAHHVNAANVLSLLGDDAAAEALYQQAVRLQGEMERAFLAHFHESDHFRRKGVRLHQAGDIPGCLRAMEMAAASIEAGTAKVAWQSPEARQLRAAIHESLAAAREAAGDREGALEAYDLLAEIPGALRAHYLAGMLLMRWADAEWHARRPEDALPRFIEARRRLMMGRRYLPPGVTEEDFREALESVDRTIKFLRDAGFEPPAR